MTKEDVLQYVDEESVKFIRLAFYNLFGVQKNVSIMPGQLGRAFERGVAIDALQVFDPLQAPSGDLIIKPDPSTMIYLPWRSLENGVIHMVCDLFYPDGTPFEADTRSLLKRVLEKLYRYGLDVLMAAKIEFYLFEKDENGNLTKKPFDQGGYMDVAPLDKGENIRREICLLLEEMGLDPHKSYHQSGPGQNEIDFHFSEPLLAADEASIFKWVVRTCANSNGLYADFSPNPLKDAPGSAMHVQVRFLEGLEKQDAFIGGLLKYLPELQLFMCHDQSSYERFKHHNAPSHFNASSTSRNVMVRIPPLAKDVLEVRLPDSNCNPYLVFALILLAGMKGIEENLSWDPNQEALPVASSLQEAHELASQSSFVLENLDESILKTYLGLEGEVC